MNSAPQSKHLKHVDVVGSKPANNPNGPKIATPAAALPSPKRDAVDTVMHVEQHFGHRLGLVIAGECSPQCGHVCALGDTSFPQTLHLANPEGASDRATAWAFCIAACVGSLQSRPVRSMNSRSQPQRLQKSLLLY